MSLSTEDREEIANTIKLVVNGNIKRVEGKLDTHISNTERMLAMYSQLAQDLGPVAEAVRWINFSKKVVLWIVGILIAISSAIQAIK